MKNNTMALADRIRQILQDMPGQEYGKRARLAQIAKAGKPVVTHWLNGQEKIGDEHAMNIAKALGYRLEWVLNGKGPRRAGESETIEFSDEGTGAPLKLIHLTDRELEIVNAYRIAGPMERTLIEHFCLKTLRDAESKKD